MTNLLPPNATPQERAITEAVDYPLDPTVIKGFKFNPSTDVLPWLIWEYGLGDIVPWLPDPSTVLKDGLSFQRLKGTPAALRMVLSWLNLHDVIIEEEISGIHFAECQLGLHQIPLLDQIKAITTLADMALPARSRLSRLYNYAYDIRRFMLDQSHWGDLLSDYSGVRLAKEGLTLSFGRRTAYFTTHEMSPPSYSCDRINMYHGVNNGLYRLDYAVLGETPPHVANIGSVIGRDRVQQIFNTCIPNTHISLTAHFVKAQIVLSEQCVLDDLNSCFPVCQSKDVGNVLMMGQDSLSDHVWELRTLSINERFCSGYTQHVDAGTLGQIITAIDHMRFIQTPGITKQCHTIRQTITHISANYTPPQTWHHHRHLNQRWCDQHMNII